MRKKLLTVLVLCLAMFSGLQVSTLAAEEFSVAVTYLVADAEAGARLDVSFVVENNTGEDKSFVCVVAMYDENNNMVDFNATNVSAEAKENVNAAVSLNLAGEYQSNYVKCFTVEDLASIRTLGNTHIISNLNPDITERYVYVNTAAGEEVIMYLKTNDNINTSGGKYVVKYNPEIMQIEDLWGDTGDVPFLSSFC